MYEPLKLYLSDDPWLFCLDWETRELKLLKGSEKEINNVQTTKKQMKIKKETQVDPMTSNPLYKILSQKQKSQVTI